MALGPGVYDVLCTYVRAQARAAGALVVIFGGNKGDGFSCQATAEQTVELPDVLDSISAQIRGDVGARTPIDRLAAIVSLIERIENRRMAVDGPVTPTTKEITEDELREIYKLAKGLP